MFGKFGGGGPCGGIYKQISDTITNKKRLTIVGQTEARDDLCSKIHWSEEGHDLVKLLGTERAPMQGPAKRIECFTLQFNFNL